MALKTIFLLIFLLIIGIQSVFALEHNERLSAAYVAIGAFSVDVIPHGTLGSMVPNQVSIMAAQKLKNTENLTSLYQAPNIEEQFTNRKAEPNIRDLETFGKEFITELLKEAVKPICKPFKICKTKCYITVIGDITDLLITKVPQLTAVKFAVQTFMLESGVSLLPKYCHCK